MHILDTDTLTHLFANNPRVIAALSEQADPRPNITIITWIEVIRGRSEAVLKAADVVQLQRTHDLLVRAQSLLNEMTVLLIDERSTEQFARLLKVKGVREIGRGDLLIASIALAHDAVLVTRNLKHFRQVPRLRLANWVD